MLPPFLQSLTAETAKAARAVDYPPITEDVINASITMAILGGKNELAMTIAALANERDKLQADLDHQKRCGFL